MTIVHKILKSFEHLSAIESGTRVKTIYGNAFDFNTLIENVALQEGEVVVLINRIVTSRMIFSKANLDFAENADVLLFFLSRTTYDADSKENEDIIEGCRNLFVRWMLQFPVDNDDVRPVGEIQMTRVYEKTDTILTGLAVSLQLQEDIGTSRCNL